MNNWYKTALAIERYLLPEERVTYNNLQSTLDIWVNKYVNLYEQNQKDPGDFEIRNKLELTTEKMNNISNKIEIFKEILKEREKEAVEKNAKGWDRKVKKFIKDAPSLGNLMEDLVVKHFGKTESSFVAGYLLADGTMIGLGTDGHRPDHRSISEAFSNEPKLVAYPGGTEGMVIFMKATGACRISITKEYARFDFKTPPTRSQARKIWSYIYKVDMIELVINDNLNNITLPDDLDELEQIIGYGG